MTEHENKKIVQMLHRLKKDGSDNIDIAVTNAVDDVHEEAITTIVERELQYVVEESFGNIRGWYRQESQVMPKVQEWNFHGRLQGPVYIVGMW